MKLNDLAKKDRAEFERLSEALADEIDPAQFPSAVVQLRSRLARFDATKTAADAKAASAEGIATFSPTRQQELLLNNLDSLGRSVLQYAVHKRIAEDDPITLARGLYQASRLTYLANSNRGADYNAGVNCLHVWDMVVSIAQGDWDVARAYKAAIAGPFKTGHLFSQFYAAAIHEMMAGSPESLRLTEERVAEAMAKKSTTLFEKGIAKTLSGTLQTDDETVKTGLTEALTYYRRADHVVREWFLGFGTCLHAHGLHRIAEKFFGNAGKPGPTRPDHPFWDEPFHNVALE